MLKLVQGWLHGVSHDELQGSRLGESHLSGHKLVMTHLAD